MEDDDMEALKHHTLAAKGSGHTLRTRTAVRIRTRKQRMRGYFKILKELLNNTVTYDDNI